ncbi:hypothetical protein FRC06_008617 [Ceratobasidium sp. 370]|nr:hypothetical protein FRC06_008617 [Ceratobasidium sp. 370]
MGQAEEEGGPGPGGAGYHYVLSSTGMARPSDVVVKPSPCASGYEAMIMGQCVAMLMTLRVQFRLAKHDAPSILVEEQTELPGSPHSGSSTSPFTSPSPPPPDQKPTTSNPTTSSDEKTTTGARGGAGLRARMAARQSAREKEGGIRAL